MPCCCCCCCGCHSRRRRRRHASRAGSSTPCAQPSAPVHLLLVVVLWHWAGCNAGRAAPGGWVDKQAQNRRVGGAEPRPVHPTQRTATLHITQAGSSRPAGVACSGSGRSNPAPVRHVAGAPAPVLLQHAVARLARRHRRNGCVVAAAGAAILTVGEVGAAARGRAGARTHARTRPACTGALPGSQWHAQQQARKPASCSGGGLGRQWPPQGEVECKRTQACKRGSTNGCMHAPAHAARGPPAPLAAASMPHAAAAAARPRRPRRAPRRRRCWTRCAT